MFGIFKPRHRLKADLTPEALLEQFMGYEDNSARIEREVQFHTVVAEVCDFLEAGFRQIAQAQAVALTKINSTNPIAGSQTRAVREATELSHKQLLMQADAMWGQSRVDAGLSP